MNKVKLIKSFADYPVWEYAYNNGEYFHSMHSTHSIHKDIVEWMKDHFEEVKERPTSWKDLWEVCWYFIDTNSDICENYHIFYVAENNKNMFKTKQQAEASIALAQITQLLDRYDIPEESKVWIYNGWSLYSVNTSANKRWWLLRFDTAEKRDHFYKHHKTLIDKLAPFYIF